MRPKSRYVMYKALVALTIDAAASAFPPSTTSPLPTVFSTARRVTARLETEAADAHAVVAHVDGRGGLVYPTSLQLLNRISAEFFIGLAWCVVISSHC